LTRGRQRLTSRTPPSEVLRNSIYLVERWLGATRALEAAIREYLAITNEAPTPFIWTKTADEILASVARFCQRISNP